jgi:sugar phosphate isomerase/epimerase
VSPVSLCVSTWNWLKPLGDAARLLPALEQALDGRFGVELWLDWTAEPALFERPRWPELVRACRGAERLSLHSRLVHRFDLETIREEIDLAAFLGADPLVVHPRSLGLEAGTWDADLAAAPEPAALERIGSILAYARSRSVRLALENGALDLLAAVAGAFPADEQGAGSALGICIDVGHANLHRARFADPAGQFLRTFADRLVHLHVSDNDGTSDQHLVPGAGTVDWRSTADTLRRIAYRGSVVMELAEPGPAHAARRAAAALASFGIPGG